MPIRLNQLEETHVIGPANKLWAVRVNDQDRRAFLAGAPVCPSLSRYQIAHLGVHHAVHPYRVVRKHQAGTFLLACFGGEGRVLADGRWQKVGSGTACLLLPHMLNALHAVPGCDWNFCWIRYQEPPNQQPFIPAGSPRVARFDAEPLQMAMLGLHRECLGQGAPDLVHHWIELIQAYVQRFTRPWQLDDRLGNLWETVASRLAEEWTLDLLARTAHLSGEHLRRLCHRHLGRSPMHHVTFLRMKRAAELLSTTRLKVEIVAQEVGYPNPFAFSTAFKRWTGWPPSDYARRNRREPS